MKYKNVKSTEACHKKPDAFKTPMLLHLMSDNRKAEAAIKVLSNFKFVIVEKEHYPYFSLQI
jgi:hypothetical protein